MNKNIFIGTGILVFILLSIGGYFFWKLLSEQTPETTIIPEEEITVTTPKKPNEIIKKTTTPPVTGKMYIQTKEGENISVNDFLHNPRTIIEKEWGATLKTDAFYTIIYYDMDQSIFISLDGGDLPTVRKDAEKELLKILGSTEEEACQLKVATTVICSVNEKACGDDYGLSFCPKGKQLPKNL